MATKTALRKVAGSITGLTSAVANTFVEAAHDIASACHDAFGGSTDIDKADIAAVQDMVQEKSTWANAKGNTLEARRSEVKAIVLAYPYLETATKVFRREHGELSRTNFLKLARMAPQCASATDTAMCLIEDLENAEKKQASGKSGRGASIGMGLGIIKNFQTRSRKIIAFRKELAALCKKYGISY